MREGYGTWFVIHSFIHSSAKEAIVGIVHRATEISNHFYSSIKV